MRLTLACLVLLDDKGREAGRQFLHDVLLRDGWQTSLDAELGTVRAFVGLLGARGLRRGARRLGRDREYHRLDEVGTFDGLFVGGHGGR